MHFFAVILNTNTCKELNKVSSLPKLCYSERFTLHVIAMRMESVIRRGVRFGYCTTNQAPLGELVA